MNQLTKMLTEEYAENPLKSKRNLNTIYNEKSINYWFWYILFF